MGTKEIRYSDIRNAIDKKNIGSGKLSMPSTRCLYADVSIHDCEFSDCEDQAQRTEVASLFDLLAHKSPLDHLSHGEKKLLNLLILCTVCEHMVLMLDDLGDSFHISWQEELSDFILPSLAKRHHNQIIYVTHSPSMIGERIDSLMEPLC
jgi:ABC-type molybdenum transport system ATPase subunit/photorepair protein PhrA